MYICIKEAKSDFFQISHHKKIRRFNILYLQVTCLMKHTQNAFFHF